MKRLRQFALRIGSLPATRVTWALVVLFSIWVVLDVFVVKFTGGVAQSSFDSMVRARIFAATADPRLVIVDIDEASLLRMGKEFGRWPWPRDTLATVLDFVEKQEPEAIVWDILFSDLDRANPGGDAAFGLAVSRSKHSHFSVVRLPKENDPSSRINQAVLPGLWVQSEATGTKSAAIALVPPALPAVAAGQLGFNNGYVEHDGILRRYRYLEALNDGTEIQSIPMSVLKSVDPFVYGRSVDRIESLPPPLSELIAWRKRADMYPRVRFSDVFEQAEGQSPDGDLPSCAGKVVVIGSTAPGLHDVHPTPLSPMHAGADVLATVVDNALNQRHVAELPRWVQALIAIGMCVGIALWVQFKGAASLAPALFALPMALMTISYLSLNGGPVFLDLHMAATLALIFLAILRYWNSLHRDYWCSPPPHSRKPMMVWVWRRSDAWLDGPLGQLIAVVEQHAPLCRVVVCDAGATWPSSLRWPEFARYAAIVGTSDALIAARTKLEPALKRIALHSGQPVLVEGPSTREQLVKCVLYQWSALELNAVRKKPRNT